MALPCGTFFPGWCDGSPAPAKLLESAIVTVNPEAAEQPPSEEVVGADLSARAKENLAVVAEFHEQEDAKISGLQLLIERISSFFGSSTYFAFAVAFMAVWIAANSWGAYADWEHFDAPPFFWLQGIVSANALLLTIAVLIRQNRMSKLAQHHSHLDLQINLLTEQKVTRVLNLIEEQRGRSVEAGRDSESVELARPADPEALLQAIKQQHDHR